jgi:hypothetical protein
VYPTEKTGGVFIFRRRCAVAGEMYGEERCRCSSYVMSWPRESVQSDTTSTPYAALAPP